MKLQAFACTRPILAKTDSKRYPWTPASTITAAMRTTSFGTVVLQIHPGFMTDLASVPWVAKKIVDDGTREIAMTKAALVHDALYATHYLSRAVADQFFRDILLLEGWSNWRASLAYRSVRLFGWHAYNSCDETKDEDRRFIDREWVPHVRELLNPLPVF